jgi:heavy metal sensor kinase
VTGTPAVRRSSATLRGRLTLWFSVVLSASVLVVAILSLFVVRRELAVASARAVRDAHRAFVREFEEEAGRQADGAAAARGAIRDLQFTGVVLAVVAPDGSLAGHSPLGGDAMFGLLGDDPRPASDSAAHERQLGAYVHRALAVVDPPYETSRIVPGSDGGSLVRVTPASAFGVTWQLVTLRSRRAEHEVLEGLLTAGLLGLPLAVLLAALGGWFIAGRGLAPVSAMGRQAAGIGAHSLHERLPEATASAELDHLTGAFNGLLARLERSFDLQRQFMADASHELRTPTAALRAHAEVLLAARGREEQEYREGLQAIASSAERLAHLIDDLLLLARADTGKYPVRRAPLDLEEVVQTAVRLVRPLADRRDVRLSASVSAEVEVTGDGALLERLFVNLVDNATKHTAAGSEVTVTQELLDGQVAVRVSDNGAGIPSGEQPRIFDRFYRVDRSRARQPGSDDGGAGLGLSIARWIAECHGGTLDLESSGPAGSTFVVRLPAG